MMRKFTIVCAAMEALAAFALLALLMLKWIGLGGETGFKNERWTLSGIVLTLCAATSICRAIENRKNKNENKV